MRHLVGRIWRARGCWGGLLAILLAWRGQRRLVGLADESSAAADYVLAIFLMIVALWNRGSAPLPSQPRPGALDHLDTAQESAEPLSTGGGLQSRWKRKLVRLGRWITAAGLFVTLTLAALMVSALHSDIASPAGAWLWAAMLSALGLTFAGSPARSSGAPLLVGPREDRLAPGRPEVPLVLEGILVAGMLLVAAALRLHLLGTLPGMLAEEGARAMEASALAESLDAPLFGLHSSGVPNLYLHSVSWMLRLFGNNLVGVRMLSALCGILLVGLSYRIGRLLWGARAGLLAGGLLAISPVALQFSRLAGGGAPAAAMWAAGFLFLSRTLRGGSLGNAVLSGMLYGASLYFWAPAQMLLLLLGGVAVYGVVRWRQRFIRNYSPAFAVLMLALSLTVLPQVLFYANDGGQRWMAWSQEKSILDVQRQPLAFAELGLTYDPLWTQESAFDRVVRRPWIWAELIVERAAATFEMLYRSSDPKAYYPIREHGGTLLPPLWAALTLLALAFAAAKLYDGRFALVGVWFWGGLCGLALAVDAPSVQRLVVVWPALMLVTGAFLDWICAAAWPLSRSLARRHSALLLGGLLGALGLQAGREYFVHFPFAAPSSLLSAQAQSLQQLGPGYHIYQIAAGRNSVPFGSPSIRFLASGVEGTNVTAPAETLPITSRVEKAIAFLVDRDNAGYLTLLRMLYPGGTVESVGISAGEPELTSYRLSAAQIAAFQIAKASYSAAGGVTIHRDEPNFGTQLGADLPAALWTPPPGLAFPAAAAWEGSLFAPSYGLYGLRLGGLDAQLEIDGRIVLQTRLPMDSDPLTPQQIEMILARGPHTVRLSGTLRDATSLLSFSWGAAGSRLRGVEPHSLYASALGGLSGEVWVPAAKEIPADLQFPLGEPPLQRRTELFFGFTDATEALGQPPLMGRWHGGLVAPVDGDYGFELRCGGPGRLVVDGKDVPSDTASGKASGSTPLDRGIHPVEIRCAWLQAPAVLEWYWTVPGGKRELVPPDALVSETRSWLRGEVPDPLASVRLLEANGQLPTPDAVLAVDAQLSQPAGLALDAAGNLFVADTGNHRVVRLDPSGSLVTAWGGPTEQPAPGRFKGLVAVTVTADGDVITLDAVSGDVQRFDRNGNLRQRLPSIGLDSNGIEVGPDGLIWIADTRGGRILGLNADGQATTGFVGGQPNTRARLEQPIDVTFAPDGTMYVTDLRQRIARLDAEGLMLAEWPLPGVGHAVVWKGLLVMTDPNLSQLHVLNPESGELHSLGKPGSGPTELSRPMGIAVGPDDRLYVLDSGNACVKVYSRLP